MGQIQGWAPSTERHASSSSWDLSLPLHIHTEHTARLWCLEHGAWSIYYFPAFAVPKHHEYRWLLCAISVITSTRNFVKTVNLSNKALFLKSNFHTWVYFRNTRGFSKSCQLLDSTVYRPQKSFPSGGVLIRCLNAEAKYLTRAT